MGAGDKDLRAAGRAAHLDEVDLHALTLGQRLAGHLLVERQERLGRLAPRADAQADGVAARVDAGDDAGENLVLLRVELVIDHAVLRLAQALDDDLLAVAGGDAAELHVLHGEVHHAADLVARGNLARVGEGDLGAGVLDLLDDLLLHIHLQVALLLVDVHDHVLHALVVALIGGNERLNDLAHHKIAGNAALLLQKVQSGENFITFHGYYSPYFFKEPIF